VTVEANAGPNNKANHMRGDNMPAQLAMIGIMSVGVSLLMAALAVVG
jgi:hypothetical protein